MAGAKHEKRAFPCLLGSLAVLVLMGCESVEPPVRRYRPGVVSLASGGVAEMGRHLGLCPREEPAGPVYGLLLEGSGGCDRRAEVGLGCGRMGGEIDVAVVLLEGDRGVRRSRGWIPADGEVMTDAGGVPLAAGLARRLEALHCVGRRGLSAAHLRMVEDICLGLKVRQGAVSVLPVVFDGRGMSRTLVGGLMKAMFGRRVLLIGVLSPGYMAGHPDWAERLSAVVTDGWHGQQVGVSGMAALEIFRQFGFSPLVLSGRSTVSGREVRVVSFAESPLSSGVMELGSRRGWAARDVLGEVSRSRGTVEISYEGEVLNETEGRILLSVVRRGLNCAVGGQAMKLSELPQYSPRFAEHYGGAICLRDGQSVYARAASLGGGEALLLELLKLCRQLARDRKSPLTAEVLSRCRLEVGVIPPPRRISYSDFPGLCRQVERGRHGVILRHGGKAAGFLPWVWGEFKDVPSFLGGLCRRTGLSPSVLSAGGAEVRLFEVVWFSE